MYFKTYGAAVQYAIGAVEKMGFVVDQDNDFAEINKGAGMYDGDTVSLDIPIYKKTREITISHNPEVEKDYGFPKDTPPLRAVNDAFSNINKMLYREGNGEVIIDNNEAFLNAFMKLYDSEIDTIRVPVYKEQEEMLHVQIYRLESDKTTYELNFYVS